jgi:hypothetical protein
MSRQFTFNHSITAKQEISKELMSHIEKDRSLKSLGLVPGISEDGQALILRSLGKKPGFELSIKNDRIVFGRDWVARSEKPLIIYLVPQIYRSITRAFQIEQWNVVGLQFVFKIPLTQPKAIEILENAYSPINRKTPMGLGKIDSFKDIDLKFIYVKGKVFFELRITNDRNNEGIIIAYDQQTQEAKSHELLSKFFQQAWKNTELDLTKFTTKIFASGIVDEPFLLTGTKEGIDITK